MIDYRKVFVGYCFSHVSLADGGFWVIFKEKTQNISG